MTSDNAFHNLMAEVLENLGLSGTSASDSGIYTIGVDGTVEIHLACPDDEAVLVFSDLGPFPEGAGSVAKNKMLLGCNAMTTARMPIVGLSPEGRLTVWQRQALSQTSTADLLDLLKNFIDSTLDIHAALNTDESETSSEPLPETHTFDPGMKA